MESTHVLVTGAAGAIGSATVRRFLDRGCDVTGLDVKAAAVDLSDDPSYTGLCGDAADAQVLERCAAGLGRLDHLVCVAGGAHADEVTDPRGMAGPAVWEATLRNNLTAPYLALLACLPLLEASPDASVTFVSSVNATDHYGLAAYSAAKAGLLGLMAGVLGPMGAAGVRVNTVVPGTVPTPRTLDAWSVRTGHFERMVDGVPLGRLGRPDDVAAAIAAFALDLRHAHGAQLVVDGGQSRSHR